MGGGLLKTVRKKEMNKYIKEMCNLDHDDLRTFWEKTNKINYPALETILYGDEFKMVAKFRVWLGFNITSGVTHATVPDRHIKGFFTLCYLIMPAERHKIVCVLRSLER